MYIYIYILIDWDIDRYVYIYNIHGRSIDVPHYTCTHVDTYFNDPRYTSTRTDVWNSLDLPDIELMYRTLGARSSQPCHEERKPDPSPAQLSNE